MATIARFVKHALPKLAHRKFLIYDSSLLRRMFESYDREFCSKFVEYNFEDNHNEVLIKSNSKSSRSRPKSTNLDRDYNFSREKNSSTKSHEISPFRMSHKNDKYKHFASYLLAKKLGEVESPESFVSPWNEKNPTVNDGLLKIPLACIYFNYGRFPNGRSLLNWIKAVDFGLERRYFTSYGVSLAINSLAKLVSSPSVTNDRLLSVVGCDRLTTWFQYALVESDRSSLIYHKSIKYCNYAVRRLQQHHVFRKWNVDSLYGLLNYSLSIYIPEQLKLAERQNDDTKFDIFFMDILKPMVNIEVGLGQPCSLEQETKKKVVSLSVEFFRYLSKLMEEPESLSTVTKRLISVGSHSIALLFCQWSVNDLPFWSDWFEFVLNQMCAIDDPVLVYKQIQSVLLVILKSNADSNFLRSDADFAKYLAEKIKPLLTKNFQANGLRFVTADESTILMRLIMDSLRASESPFFTLEELNEILEFLNRRKYED